MSSGLRNNLEGLYRALDRLESGLGGKRVLGQSHGRMAWPKRGVYFFFEPGEYQPESPSRLRVARVGTHGVSENSRSSLWERLRAHKGTDDGGGNHRSSIFRLHVGVAMLRSARIAVQCSSWGRGQTRPLVVDTSEATVERAVSEYLGNMEVLWLDVPDVPSAKSDRAYLERNAIALLAAQNHFLRSQSATWLGEHSDKVEIRSSGLWNVDHVTSEFDQRFLEVLEQYVEITLGSLPRPTQSLAPPGWKGGRIENLELPFS